MYHPNNICDPMDEDSELAVLEVLTDAACLVADDKTLCCNCKCQQNNEEGGQ